ncbi:hypothetical protein V8D89_009633, partial [Ganoderma adspersum]
FKIFEDPQQVRYAILSHVWSKPEDRDDEPEQTYQKTCQILDGILAPDTTPLSQYSRKIQHFCAVALSDGYEWGWVDSSCIDKSSSSELSEAINSMYDWYRYAAVCYAFLHDLPDINPSDSTFCDEFGKAKWFRRGWTLQELLAPSVLIFLSRTWRMVGSKYTLASVVETVTGIDSSVLTFKQSLDTISIARKMSWAARRMTTRPEDEAYLLMGIFGVTIPISYGEGHNAFIRLQEQILKHHPDQTIFAWGRFLGSPDFGFVPPNPRNKLRASSPPSLLGALAGEFLLPLRPHYFEESQKFKHLPRDVFAQLLGVSPAQTYQEFTITSYGMRARVPLLTIYCGDHHLPYCQPTHLALLACQDQAGNMLALLLRSQKQPSGPDFVVGAVVADTNTVLTSRSSLLSHYYRVTYLSSEQVASCQRNIEMVDLYIPYRPPIAVQKLELEAPIHALLCDSRENFEVLFSGWSRRLLAQDGYTTVTPAEDETFSRLGLAPSSASTTTAVVISKGNEHITIHIGRCSCAPDIKLDIDLLAVTVSARGRSSPLSEVTVQKPHYRTDNPAHVQSWDFRGGVASKEVLLESPTQPTITLRLTFTHDTQTPTRSKRYQLGVEISLVPLLVSEPPLPVSTATGVSSVMPPNLKFPRTYSQVAASSLILPSASTTRAGKLAPARLPPNSQPPPLRPSSYKASGFRDRQPLYYHDLSPRPVPTQTIPSETNQQAKKRSSTSQLLEHRG